MIKPVLLERRAFSGNVLAEHNLQSVRVALRAGADGVVLSREYVEIWLADLSAAGETLREIFKQRPA